MSNVVFVVPTNVSVFFQLVKPFFELKNVLKSVKVKLIYAATKFYKSK